MQIKEKKISLNLLIFRKFYFGIRWPKVDTVQICWWPKLMAEIYFWRFLFFPYPQNQIFFINKELFFKILPPRLKTYSGIFPTYLKKIKSLSITFFEKNVDIQTDTDFYK